MTTINRRSLIALSAGGLAALAGCADSNGGDDQAPAETDENDGDELDPERALEVRAEEFLEVLNAGDPEGYESIVAGEAPLSAKWDESDAKECHEVSAHFDAIEISEFGGDEATVVMPMEFPDTDVPDEIDIALTYSWRLIDGEWFVWELLDP